MNFTASFTLKLINRLTSPLRDVVGGVEDLDDAAEEAADAVDELADELEDVEDAADDATDAARDNERQLSRLERGALSAGRAINRGLLAGFKAIPGLLKAGAVGLSTFIGSMVTATTAAALWVRSESQRAESITKAAEAAGIATDTYQRLSYAFEKNGLDGEKLKTTIDAVAQRQKMAAAGSKQQAALFKSLGISVRDAKAQYKTFDVILGEVADRFVKDPAKVKKLIQANDLLGESGNDLIPLLNQGSAGIKALGDEAAALGLILSSETLSAADKMNKGWELMTGRLRGIGLSIFAAVLPPMTLLINRIGDIIEQNKGQILAGLTKGLTWLTTNMPAVLDGIGKFIKFVVDVSTAASGFVSSLGGMSNVLDGLAVLLIGNMALSLMATTTAIWGVSAALFSCPVTWIIAGIAGIAVAAYFLIRHWKSVAKFFGGLWDWLKKSFNALPGWAQPFVSLPLTIITHWKDIVGWFANTWKALQATFKAGVDAVWNFLPEWFRNVLKGAAFVVKFGFNKVKEAFDSDETPATAAAPQSLRRGAGAAQSLGVGAGASPQAFNGQGRVTIGLDAQPGVRLTRMSSDSDNLILTSDRGLQGATR